MPPWQCKSASTNRYSIILENRLYPALRRSCLSLLTILHDAKRLGLSDNGELHLSVEGYLFKFDIGMLISPLERQIRCLQF